MASHRNDRRRGRLADQYMIKTRTDQRGARRAGRCRVSFTVEELVLASRAAPAPHLAGSENVLDVNPTRVVQV